MTFLVFAELLRSIINICVFSRASISAVIESVSFVSTMMALKIFSDIRVFC